MLSINEEFYSIQGEGLHTGIPMYFVRLQGCQVGCYFCDTKYTWKPKEANVEEKDIILRSYEHSVDWICITGGEPYEQDLKTLVELCHEHRLKVHVETSGTVWQDLPIDWICLSPKDLFSKRKTLGVFVAHADEIKCVVTKEDDIDYWLENYYTNQPQRPLIFQPVDNNVALIEMIMKKTKGMSNIRVMLQEHKVMNLR